MALIRNMFAGIGCLVVVLAVGLAAWYYRADIEAWMNSRNEIVMSEPSPELALRAEEKIREVLDGDGERETRLSEMELQSYVQYRLAEQLPAGVDDPAVDLRDSTLAFSAGIDFRRLRVADPNAVANLRRMIGDSTLVTTELYPRVGRVGEGRVEVLSLQAGVFPVPPLFIGSAIQQVRQLGLRTEGRTVLLDIPADVIEFRIENEELVLIRDR